MEAKTVRDEYMKNSQESMDPWLFPGKLLTREPERERTLCWRTPPIHATLLTIWPRI